MEPKRIVVAGIGTEVGKTVCAAILCEALKADYWKPVQAGSLEQGDSAEIKRLTTAPEITVHPEAFTLTQPMSPHAAAAIDELSIDDSALSLPQTNNHLIIELAGGLMVPLNERYLNIDWVQQINLPVVLVSNYYLGSINHTLLSYHALKERNIPCLGIIFNGSRTESTFSVIRSYTQLPCLLELGTEQSLTKEIIAQYASNIQL